MTHADQLGIPVALMLVGAVLIGACMARLITVLRRRPEPAPIVPAGSLADRYPLPEPRTWPQRQTRSMFDDLRAEDAWNFAPRTPPIHTPEPLAVRADAVVHRIARPLPGYGKHDRAVAKGSDSQRDIDSPTGALDPTAVSALLVAENGRVLT